MANLNFQQPPRSIPSSASLSGRGGTAGGFGNSSLSGHVTPTSGMFPTGATGAGSFGQSQPTQSQQQQQQQQQQAQQQAGQQQQPGQNQQQQPPQLSPSTASSARNGAGGGGGGGGSGSGGGAPGSGVGGAGGVVGVGGVSGGGGGGVVGSANPSTPSASSNGPSQQPNQQSQLSSSNSTSGGANARNNLFGSQRGGFADRRTMPGLGGAAMSNMVSFMQSRGYGSQSGNSLNNYHSVFDNGTAETGTPPLLDLSEFPSLTNARGGQNDQSLPQSNALQPPGSKPYVGMVKQPTSEQTEFTMSNEDFPALPGTQNAESGQLAASQGLQGVHHHHHSDHHGADSLGKSSGGSIGGAVGMGMDLQSDSGNSNVSIDKGAMKRGVQTSPNGMVTNIPASMVNNQFGMVGLLTFIRAAESDPNLVTLAMGQDLTALGLNLASSDNLYPSFGGPFADSPARPQDIDYNVPPEYLINISIREKLSKLTLQKYKDDLLFYLFYTNVGDVMQLAAAAELHSRDWRYHTEEKVWITRVPGMATYEKSGTTERGTYYYFDAQTWRRVPKEFEVDRMKLDKCPNLSAYVTLSGQPV